MKLDSNLSYFVFALAEQPVLLVSNRYYIRNITLHGTTGQERNVLVSNLQNAVALDFDWTEKYIYWSDVMNTGSSMSRMKIDGSGKQVMAWMSLFECAYVLVCVPVRVY